MRLFLLQHSLIINNTQKAEKAVRVRIARYGKTNAITSRG